MTTACLFILLFGCMLIGMPIAIALGLSSVATILMFSQDSLSSISLKLYASLSGHYTLLAIPFFILASSFLQTGGVAKRIIRFALSLVGFVRGGMAMASVIACMIFAAVSGSSPATVAAIGSIAIGGMVKSGYPESLAAGVVGTAGTLGILIPPSIVMLVYSAATEVSAARMFMAGFLPGLLMGLMLMAAIYIVARVKKIPSQPWTGFGEIFAAGFSASGGLMLIVIVLGAIYGGIASPTEAAAVSTLYSFGVCVWGYRDMGPLKNVPWRKSGESFPAMLFRNIQQIIITLPKMITDKEINKVVLDSAKVSIMLLFIIANAMLFAHVLTTERIPHHIAEMIVQWGLSPWMFLMVVNILLLIAGNFMEPSAIVLIMAPILFPIAIKLGIDPVHLGVIMVVNMEIGMLTPPVGLNLFVISGVTGKSMGWAIKACMPWLLVLLTFLGIITYIPEITMFLPQFLDKVHGY